MRYKPTILIDLDGVLNEYKGNYSEDYIPDIKDGAQDFVKELAQCYKLYLFTTRNPESAKKWLIENDMYKYFEDVTNSKIPSYIILDDRGICFDGNYQTALANIKDFKVWYK